MTRVNLLFVYEHTTPAEKDQNKVNLAVHVFGSKDELDAAKVAICQQNEKIPSNGFMYSPGVKEFFHKSAKVEDIQSTVDTQVERMKYDERNVYGVEAEIETKVQYHVAA